MKTRRNFFRYCMLGLSLFVTALISAACGQKPDAETEPSPEWPPKE